MLYVMAEIPYYIAILFLVYALIYGLGVCPITER